MEVVGGILQALFMLLSFVLWLVPLAITIWVLVKIAELSRNVDTVRRQLTVIAEQTGAQVIPPPPVKPRRTPAPLWAFAIVLVVFLVVVAGLYVVGTPA